MDLGHTLTVPTERGHYVYQHLDADANVLYVGMTSNPLVRLANHIAGQHTKSPWWHKVCEIRWERVSCYWDARAREEALIAQCRPPHNKASNPAWTSGARPVRSQDSIEPIDIAMLRSLHRKNPDHLSAVVDSLAVAS